MIGHRKSQLFIPSHTSYSEDDIQRQPVLSATVSDRKVVGLPSPVVYTIRNLEVRAVGLSVMAVLSLMSILKKGSVDDPSDA